MAADGKPLIWLAGEVESPPFSSDARIEAGVLLRRLQSGDSLGLPDSRSMPSVGKRCHELRIQDRDKTWRIVSRRDPDAVLVLEFFAKKTERTPNSIIDVRKTRLRNYDEVSR